MRVSSESVEAPRTPVKELPVKSPVIIEQKEEDEATPAKKQKKQKKKKFVEPVPIPTGKVATYVPAQQTRASEEDWTFVDR